MRGRKLRVDHEAVLYLLKLPGCDREKVEARLFLEEGFSEVLETAERDLLDCYACGLLPGDMRPRVESELLFDERQRDKLRVAKTLAQNKPRGRNRWVAQRVAASLLVAAAAAYLLYFMFADHPVLHEARVPTSTRVPSRSRAAVTATFLVTPGSLRGAHVQAITIPANAELVRLELADADGRQAYSATLTDQSGAALWRQDELRAKDGGVEITIPRTFLRSGRFRLILNGPPMVTYYFRVNQSS